VKKSRRLQWMRQILNWNPGPGHYAGDSARYTLMVWALTHEQAGDPTIDQEADRLAKVLGVLPSQALAALRWLPPSVWPDVSTPRWGADAICVGATVKARHRTGVVVMTSADSVMVAAERRGPCRYTGHTPKVDVRPVPRIDLEVVRPSPWPLDPELPRLNPIPAEARWEHRKTRRLVTVTAGPVPRERAGRREQSVDLLWRDTLSASTRELHRFLEDFHLVLPEMPTMLPRRTV